MDSYPDTLVDTPNKLDSPSGSVRNGQVDVQLAAGSGEDQDKATRTRIIDGIRHFIEEHWNIADPKECDILDDDQTLCTPLLDEEDIPVLSKPDGDTTLSTSTSSSQGKHLLSFFLGLLGLTPPVRESIKKIIRISGGNWNSEEGLSFSRSLVYLFFFLVDTLDLLGLIFWHTAGYGWVKMIITSRPQLGLYSIAYQQEPDARTARSQEAVYLFLYLASSLRGWPEIIAGIISFSTLIQKFHAIRFYFLIGYHLIFLNSSLSGLATMSRDVDRYLSKTLGRPVVYSFPLCSISLSFIIFWVLRLGIYAGVPNTGAWWVFALSYIVFLNVWDLTLISFLFVAKAGRRYSGERTKGGNDEEENR